MPSGSTLEPATIAGIPLYDADVEAQGIPPLVASLKDRVAAADGLLLVTPEYNNSMPGVLKNAIDWLSRPALASVLRWKPVAIVGASSGRGGTRRAQQQVRDALLFPGAVVLEEPQVTLPMAWERFDPDLELTDENAGAALTELVAGLLELTREKHPAAA
jgi:chromate reductase